MSRRSRRLPLVAALGVAACSGSDTPSSTETSSSSVSSSSVAGSTDSANDGAGETSNTSMRIDADATMAGIGRVDIQTTGNRVIEGPGSFTTVDPIEVAFPGTPVWVVRAPSFAGRPSWLVVTAPDGQAYLVDDEGTMVAFPGEFSVSEPPMPSSTRRLFLHDDGDPVDGFDEAIPDARIVASDGVAAILVGPTDRYPHGVLGDEIEASGITALDRNSRAVTSISMEAPDVFEAVTPMLADVDGNGDVEIVVTASSPGDGSRLRVFDSTGSPLAASAPIGTGNRWRNLLAVAPTGPDGEIEVIDVRTPHIGDTLQFFQLDVQAGTLERVATAEQYSTHSIGSRNLDLGIVSDADGDERLDVLLPTQDHRAIAVVTRVDDGDDDDRDDDSIEEIFRFDLGTEISTNLSAQQTDDGSVAYALGTTDDRLLIWRSTPPAAS